MTQKKRWEDVYKEENPFRLPYTLLRALKESAENFHNEYDIKYLWIYVSHDALGEPQTGTSRLTLDDWLSVVDEAASLGVEHVVVSVGGTLADHPEVAEICRWAQSVYGMQVGVHFYGQALPQLENELIQKLDTANTTIFFEPHLEKAARIFQEQGFAVFPAEGQDQDYVSPDCHLPEQMTCVGASGTLYTCGLVLGDKQYRLGHCFERKIGHYMKDASLPHVIPEGMPKTKHRCNGCPPLMVEKMRKRPVS